MKKAVYIISMSMISCLTTISFAQTSKQKNMTLENNKQVFIKFNREFFGNGDTAIAKVLLTETFVNHTPPPNAPDDASPMIKFTSEFHKGFSNIHFEVHEVVAEGNKVALRKTMTATNTGPFFGNAPSGKTVTLNSIEIAIIKDGKITDYWAKNDYMQALLGNWAAIEPEKKTKNDKYPSNKNNTESNAAIEKNKQTVIKFNTELFELANTDNLKEFLANGFANHTAPANGLLDDRANGVIQFASSFHKGFSNIKVQIDEVIAEGDKVVLFKTVTATHTGEFMDKTPTGKAITLHVIEMDILKDGKITDQWSRNDLMLIVQGL
ncbi:ester cyclase [Mucilaginibacter sp. HC2]|uniref:ester cyclase n=1 Tax=Mucilaginibacter inviolabilis TaxID=2714892 RepID=UPI00140A987F|nr:ester cyclase [Mucilaginibacter inviolabilis]NHA05443.1 ester cyclase [Mucilaginibacter inviolabilis]